MRKILQLGLAVVAAIAIARGAGADELLSESRPVSARVERVKLDGAVSIRLRQGSAASLTIFAEKRLLSKVTTVQAGDTLHIASEGGAFKFIGNNLVRVDVVLPALRQLSSEGLGTSDVSGFTGDELSLSLDGAGTMKVVGDYKKLSASLGGVGSMQIWVNDNDRADVDLRGAGYVTLGGRSKALKASMGGLGSLNAQQFQVENVTLELSGLGNATVNARQNATLSLSGLGSVTVFGRPQGRNVSVDGLGKVSWK
ncbi:MULTISPECIES: GIN domain-containing protein [unclassified Janthinobacterium]|uniref:GIN domain-containing protein n=1 Tax=unclassified Janthinobacterium TaxID=2610881 RepID=UPI0003462DE6|nr:MULTISPECIES: DUF2807 domain-containing protein [unclassified Janthinobacterium]MEC5159337.1 hypothetical protein [Janthinobacterium sp. CG_S6]